MTHQLQSHGGVSTQSKSSILQQI